MKNAGRGKLSKGILLQKDNARVHTCKIAMDALERNGYELIPHLAFSLDLTPSDYFLFPNLKKDIRGRHFRSNEEVVVPDEEWVGDKYPGFFSSGLMALEHRWSKCIILEGNYIEKRRDRSNPEISKAVFLLLALVVYRAQAVYRGQGRDKSCNCSRAIPHKSVYVTALSLTI